MPIVYDESLLVATYADDTAFLASSSSRRDASESIQGQLNTLEAWLRRWNIVVNAEKSTQTTFSLRPGNCPLVSLNGSTIPYEATPKYLGMTLDRRLTWKKHLERKRKLISDRVKQYYWLIGGRSKLRLQTKLLVYKAIIKPIWTYGIQLWGTTSKSNRAIIQRCQSKTLHIIAKAHPYHDNATIHKQLNIPWVHKEIVKRSTRYSDRLSNHSNTLAINLLDNSTTSRRLQRAHPLDLPFLTAM
ncbi:hypothetical protein KR018_005083 [Drosophila ironensis]|nr:hypothetical protein KR018_005083 [Drosophila ironensis]